VKERDYWENLDVNEIRAIRQILMTQWCVGMEWTGLDCSCEHVKEFQLYWWWTIILRNLCTV